MLIFLKVVSVVYMGVGILIFLKPECLKQYINFWRLGKRIYAGGALAFLLGVIFLLSAFQCRLPGIIITLGILSLAKGLIIFSFKLEKIKSILDWYDKKSLLVIRLVGVAALAIGILWFYSV